MSDYTFFPPICRGLFVFWVKAKCILRKQKTNIFLLALVSDSAGAPPWGPDSGFYNCDFGCSQLKIASKTSFTRRPKARKLLSGPWTQIHKRGILVVRRWSLVHSDGSKNWFHTLNTGLLSSPACFRILKTRLHALRMRVRRFQLAAAWLHAEWIAARRGMN